MHNHQLRFTENKLKNRISSEQQFYGLKRVRGEGTDWFEVTERQQKLK